MPLLKIKVIHFVCSLEVIALHVLNHHILTIELLDNDFAVLRVGVYAADIVVGDPYRIVAIFGINREIPRSGLILIHRQCNLGAKERGNLADSFLDKFLLVLPSEPVDPSGEDGEQQDDENHDEC